MIKMRAKLANLSHCAVPLLNRAAANMCMYYITPWRNMCWYYSTPWRNMCRYYSTPWRNMCWYYSTPWRNMCWYYSTPWRNMCWYYSAPWRNMCWYYSTPWRNMCWYYSTPWRNNTIFSGYNRSTLRLTLYDNDERIKACCYIYIKRIWSIPLITISIIRKLHHLLRSF